jgi:hypothetical protein
MTRRRWWATGLVTAWGLGLLVAAVWSVHHGPATVRGQSDLTTGRQAVERAVTTLVEAAGPAVTVDVGPYRTTTGCRLTLSRRGTELDRTVVLTVPAGQEAALLERLVGGLPAGWSVRYHPDAHEFSADAGDFVAVRGEVAEPGRVRVTAATGCRPGTGPGPGQ